MRPDDASLLLPLIGFLPADDPRIVATAAAIERELTEGGLVRRKAAKGDRLDEGVFLACSCWMADCMTMQSRTDEAPQWSIASPAWPTTSGCSAKEYHMPSRRLIGNMPQALSHLPLVNSALFPSGPVIQRGAA